VKVLQANGRRRELVMPVVWENAHDPDFRTKVAAIKNLARRDWPRVRRQHADL